MSISPEELAQCDGVRNECMWIAIMGTIFDVTANTKMYGPGKGYHVFVGKDASRALAKSSLEKSDTESTDISQLTPKEQKTLDDWYTFFQKRYTVVGKLR